MTTEYDTIVVGAGIAGLMTALRLAHAGERVIVLEQHQIASGSTGKNHGIIHSGSVYADLHPELVPLCQQACALFAQHFPHATINRNPTIHIMPAGQADVSSARFSAMGIKCVDRLPPAALEPLDEALLRGKDLLGIDSFTVSSKHVCASLAQAAMNAGARLRLHTAVLRLFVERDAVVGVVAPSGERILGGRVILCCGPGTSRLLAAAGLPHERFLTRADIMVTVPGVIHYPVVEYGFGGSYVVPALGGRSLVSFFGGVQPFLGDASARVDVPIARADQVIKSLSRLFRPSVFRLDEATAYTCLKTELRGSRSDAWGVEPYHAIIDHAASDGVRGLWTLLPGKMTFAFHATQELCNRLHQATRGVELPVKAVEATDDVLHQTAWAPAEGMLGAAWSEPSTR
ncbi:FAD-dependent oxidoreductase [Sorangium sp. So ce281]|uniref:NAD(P)/FAD-dependent oxidoreductase n=1 Tax=unclassified Sorangium TaxID=2621164 RepID=UPI003F5DCE7B